MFRLTILALLTLSLFGCSTVRTEPTAIRLPAELVQPCEPLPMLDVQPGVDLRGPILENRVESERVHAECAARHRAVVESVTPRARPERPTRSRN